MLGFDPLYNVVKNWPPYNKTNRLTTTFNHLTTKFKRALNTLMFKGKERKGGKQNYIAN